MIKIVQFEGVGVGVNWNARVLSDDSDTLHRTNTSVTYVWEHSASRERRHKHLVEMVEDGCFYAH